MTAGASIGDLAIPALSPRKGGKQRPSTVTGGQPWERRFRLWPGMLSRSAGQDRCAEIAPIRLAAFGVWWSSELVWNDPGASGPIYVPRQGRAPNTGG
jgi:hypothetical protein